MEERRAIAVDLGGTHIRVGVVSESGELDHHTAIPTESHRGPQSVIGRIGEQINALAARVELPADIPIGVASPGPLNPRTGVVLYTPNLPNWRDVPFVQILQDATNRKVHIANDGNCAALGEIRFGSARGVDDLIYFALGTGVGGGIVSGGVLVDGVRGLGAEVGHLGIAMDGPRCSCGSIGCLEAFASGWAIKREAEAVATTADGDTIRELAGDGEIHAGIVALAADNGDQAARLILDRAGRALGAAMGALTNIFNPSMIVVGGGVATIGEHLMKPARETMLAYSFVDMRADVTIAYSALGKDTGIFGAAALAFAQSGRAQLPS
jgi:glucokinase